MRNLNNPKMPLKVQPRSGFDKSHFHLFTSTVGTITPVLIDEVIGNSKVNLRVNIAASMPPLAADTFMKTDLCVEAFFVPLRLCSASFEPWFCQRSDPAVGNAGVSDWSAYLPIGQIDLSLQPGTGDTQPALDTLFGHRGLAEFLGWRAASLGSAIFNLNLMPFVAYHLCWDWYYRNNNVQKSCFAEVDSTFDLNDSDQMYVAAVLPHLFNRHKPVLGSTLVNDKQWNYWLLADNVSLFALRKRNFDFDYFTNALPNVSVGGNQDVMISPGGLDGKFSIAALRAANSLQIFNERNMLSSPRYIDTLKQRFGGHPSAGVAQMPILLGSARYNVYNKSVNVTAGNAPSGAPYPSLNARNPFTSIAGSPSGVAYASGSDFIIDNFTADEPGYIIVNATLVPTVTYSNGCDRLLTRYRTQSITDMATHALQNVGNQPIYQYELTGKIGTSDTNMPVFGYTDRYSDFMFMADRITGLFQKGMALDMFVSQRYITYSDSPFISSSFLQIPTDYLDPVLIYNKIFNSQTSFGFWAQVGFDYKVSMPLAEYSIPSLQDPAYEHGNTITIHRGGFRL